VQKLHFVKLDSAKIALLFLILCNYSTNMILDHLES